MIFRRATNRDIPEVQRIVFSALEEYGLLADPEKTDLDLSDLENFYFLKGGYFEVCEINDKVVGTWGLSPLDSQSCELRKMYLSSSQRGKGLGIAMLERVVKKANEMGFRRIELETASALRQAINLYVKYGFKLISKQPLVKRCDQTYELYL